MVVSPSIIDTTRVEDFPEHLIEPLPNDRYRDVYLVDQSKSLSTSTPAALHNVRWLTDRIKKVSYCMIHLLEGFPACRARTVEAWAVRVLRASIIQPVAQKRLKHIGHKFNSQACPELADALTDLSYYFPSELCFMRLLTLHKGIVEMTSA